MSEADALEVVTKASGLGKKAISGFIDSYQRRHLNAMAFSYFTNCIDAVFLRYIPEEHRAEVAELIKAEKARVLKGDV
jgi:hypothetical protein